MMVQLIDFCIACSSADCSILQLQTALYGFFCIVYWKMFYYHSYKNRLWIQRQVHILWKSNYVLSLKWSTWTMQH